MLTWFQSQFYKAKYIPSNLSSIPVPSFHSLCTLGEDVNIRIGTLCTIFLSLLLSFIHRATINYILMLTTSPKIDISPVILVVWRLFSSRYLRNNSWDIEKSLYLENSLSEYKKNLGSDFLFWFTPEDIKFCCWKLLTIFFHL